MFCWAFLCATSGRGLRHLLCLPHSSPVCSMPWNRERTAFGESTVCVWKNEDNKLLRGVRQVRRKVILTTRYPLVLLHRDSKVWALPALREDKQPPSSTSGFSLIGQPALLQDQKRNEESEARGLSVWTEQSWTVAQKCQREWPERHGMAHPALRPRTTSGQAPRPAWTLRPCSLASAPAPALHPTAPQTGVL